MRSNPENIQVAVLAVERVFKQNMYGYTGDEKSLFLKITLALPRLVSRCKKIVEEETILSEFRHQYIAFESNIDFDIRCALELYLSLFNFYFFKINNYLFKIYG